MRLNPSTHNYIFFQFEKNHEHHILSSILCISDEKLELHIIRVLYILIHMFRAHKTCSISWKEAHDPNFIARFIYNSHLHQPIFPSISISVAIVCKTVNFKSYITWAFWTLQMSHNKAILLLQTLPHELNCRGAVLNQY